MMSLPTQHRFQHACYPSPHFEISRTPDYDLDTDTLSLVMSSDTYERHYEVEYRFCEAQITRVRHCRYADDADYPLSDEPLERAEEEALRRWLEAEDGRGSAAEHYARLKDAALTNYDPRD